MISRLLWQLFIFYLLFFDWYAPQQQGNKSVFDSDGIMNTEAAGMLPIISLLPKKSSRMNWQSLESSIESLISQMFSWFTFTEP